MDPVKRRSHGKRSSSRRRTVLTLGSLFEAIQDQVSPGDDPLVVAVVTHLIRTGKLKFAVQ